MSSASSTDPFQPLKADDPAAANSRLVSVSSTPPRRTRRRAVSISRSPTRSTGGVTAGARRHRLRTRATSSGTANGFTR
ncbi:hypothetical protein ACIFUY_11130 [Streptomyces sp. CACIS-1.16CA]|uniref:hypothetical protein n=1 Tax=Streptomyces sp. CACIS-1.16CA TaxID=1175510 RepID=UPI0037CEFE2D